MMEDIGPLLKNWPFSQDNSIRKIIDEDGTEKIQVRVDQGAFQGILQMELDGRPDGHKPHRSPFLLDYFQNKRDQYVEKNGKDEGFELTESNCAELFDESRQIYERYVFLLQMQDYDRVIQDTERNMDLFRYVNHYAAKEKDRLHLEKWWPYVLRINAIARVMIATENKDYVSGIGIIRDVLGKIEALPQVDAEEFHMEKDRSLRALNELLEELEQKRPLSEVEELKKELLIAIENEDFEQAAELRDRIHKSGQSS